MIKKETISSKIEFLFKSKYFLVLKLFLDNKDSEFFVNEIKRKTKLSPLLVVDVLREFESKGILSHKKRANALFYRLNKESKIVILVEGLFSK